MHGVHVLNKRTIEEAQHHCCPLLISPVSLANHDAINVQFLLRTSKCDSEFEGGETKSHGEELQAVCGYHAADRKHAPRLREAALVSPPDGAAFPGGGRPALPQPTAASHVRQAGAFLLGATPRDPPPHRDHEENAGQTSSGASDSRPDLCSSEPPRSSETGRI